MHVHALLHALLQCTIHASCTCTQSNVFDTTCTCTCMYDIMYMYMYCSMNYCPIFCCQSDGSSSIFEMREQKLKNLAELAMPDPLEESSSQLVEFDSQPSSPNKADMFNFYQPFSPTLDESDVIPSSSQKKKRLNKHSSRHLLYASYFPVVSSKLSKQERIVVLCGTGHTRLKVENLVDGILSKGMTIFRDLYKHNSLVLPSSCTEFIKEFQMLPNFDQNEIASLCANQILQHLTSPDNAKDCYPSCSQLIFVCLLLEIGGSFRKLMDLLVELVSFTSDKKEDKRQNVRLLLTLCVPIVNLLWYYFPILLLSIVDTSLIYEG